MQRTWRRGYDEMVPVRTIEDSLKELEGFITSIHSGKTIPVDDLCSGSEMFPSKEGNYTTRAVMPRNNYFIDELSEFQSLVSSTGVTYHINRVSMAVKQKNGENGRKSCGKKSSAIIPPWIDVPEHSRFFVIKSSCLEHVKKSFYNGIWSSTHFGNKRLSEAYASLPVGAKIFLFFSVNGSGRFCGVAEMTSDLESGLDTSIWGDTKKYGAAFKVRWIIVRDVQNRLLKRFLIPANEMKPVTNSRDTQEIPAAICKSILKLFKYDQNNVQSFLDHDYS
ncbi:hypothetical protein HG537_0A06520 [Torulaspora globosa]|uniref:YTH domain-containing protein n=1 Tax=Torulaspora globosa TaxID=48254 RepID=A0A7H9HPX7_9SACH|nr:hypothetical protein HG537_0A06520 [Torulaspora sp. CBS 2947]